MARIAAIITCNREEAAGGAPILYASNPAELQKLASLTEKILDCTAHALHEGLFLIVDHHVP